MTARATWPAIPAKPVPPRAFTRSFPARADQVREARAFLRAALEGGPAADDAVLCVSELVANAVLHSDSRKPGGTFTVRAEIHPGNYLWVEAEDNGGQWNQHPHRDGRPHGLDIVAALAADSGIDGDPVTGWVAWARFDLPPASPPPGASAHHQTRPAIRGQATAPPSATDDEPGAGSGSSGRALCGIGHVGGGATPTRAATQGQATEPLSDPAHATTVLTDPAQALTGLRDALAVYGIATTGMTLARHSGKLHRERGPAIGYHGGLYWWPTRRLHARRPIYAIHDARDPAGAACRIAPHHQPATSSEH